MLKTHLFSRSYFTDCFQSTTQRTLHGALVTLAMLLRIINRRFIIIIIINV